MDSSALPAETYVVRLENPRIGDAVGLLTVDRGKTVLELESAAEIRPARGTRPWYQLISTDGKRITLADCLAKSIRTRYGEEVSRHSATIFPHYVLIGHRYISKTDLIKSIQFTVNNANDIFYRFDDFSIALRGEQLIGPILDHQSAILERPMEVGSRPIVAFFNGITDLAEIQGPSYTIKVHRNIRQRLSGYDKIDISGNIQFTINFSRSVNFHEAVATVTPALLFLDIIAGRPQDALGECLSLSNDSDDWEPAIRLLPSMPSRRQDDSATENLQPSDLPLCAGENPQEFERVFATWLSMHSSRKDARERFSGCFRKEHRFSVDRLVAAANMFDILPDNALPEARPLDVALEEAKGKALAAFKNLPPSPDRDSARSALGRLGRPNLKHKIRHRGAIVQAASADGFQDLDFVIDEAVNCRNHYVHGSNSRYNYADNFFAFVPFFTTTLEFIFAASELIESGWNIDEWLRRGTTMTHPFGAYRVDYNSRLSNMRRVMADSVK